MTDGSSVTPDSPRNGGRVTNEATGGANSALSEVDIPLSFHHEGAPVLSSCRAVAWGLPFCSDCTTFLQRGWAALGKSPKGKPFTIQAKCSFPEHILALSRGRHILPAAQPVVRGHSPFPEEERAQPGEDTPPAQCGVGARHPPGCG